ncbi:LacI family transcriptional regulator [Spirochaetia bacterium]|nr:LacI family transcriptional regulator [Spirochaetia bacterium]
MVNIKDIAKKAGISPATISRVINGKSNVSPEKRDLVLKLIEETGYVPNQAARNMVLRRSFTVGIVISDTFNMFQRQLFSFIERHLTSFGYHTMFFFVTFDGSSEDACLAKLKSVKPDGLIMIHEIRSPVFYEYLERSRLPFITATFSRPGFPSIHVDDEAAAFDAVNHLINLGHRKIRMISSEGFSCGLQRADGFFKALEQAGVMRNEKDNLVMVRHYTTEFGMYGMRELLLRSRDFSAVFAATDELAIGAMRALRDEGFRIPEDVSVVGFDDIEIADYLMPRLTSIRQPFPEIGEQAASSLHKQISGKYEGGLDLTAPYRLVIRESTALYSG